MIRRKIAVTDHAVVRYLERVIGINMEEIRDQILPLEKEKLILKNGDGIYPVNGEKNISHRIIVKDGTVLTVQSPDMRYFKKI